ncbi:MAG: class I SAM-dependent methyltransferase [Nanoarchaeota archaeon]|nr:class I SAM-dependent methyltransferase [Nanoarchaeota archaeon]
MKKFEIGIVIKYPLRTSVKFARNYFRGKEIVVAEIGTYKGENALNMLEKLKIKRIYLIDPYEAYGDYKEDTASKNTDKNFKSAKRRLKKYSNRTIYIKKFSDEAWKFIPEELDFIYLDGNHEYKYVKKDMEIYWKKLKKEGILAGHDISWPGVSKSFCEFVQEKDLNPNIQAMDWWIVKK